MVCDYKFQNSCMINRIRLQVAKTKQIISQWPYKNKSKTNVNSSKQDSYMSCCYGHVPHIDEKLQFFQAHPRLQIVFLLFRRPGQDGTSGGFSCIIWMFSGIFYFAISSEGITSSEYAVSNACVVMRTMAYWINSKVQANSNCMSTNKLIELKYSTTACLVHYVNKTLLHTTFLNLKLMVRDIENTHFIGNIFSMIVYFCALVVKRVVIDSAAFFLS